MMSLSGSCGSCSNRNRPISSGSRPKMLKDFLIEDTNSWSSRRLTSLPRLPSESSIKTNLEAKMPSPYKAIMLMRSRSKAASMTISALEAMVKVARAIPRTLSKRQSSNGIENPNKAEKIEEFADTKSVVRIKDIIRWSSFRDMDEEEPQLLKLAPPSPADCTTATTVSTLSTSSTSSSWSESDFSSDYSPPWSSNDRDFYNNERFSLDCHSMLNCVKQQEPTESAEKVVHFSRGGVDSAEEDLLEKWERSFSAMEIESKEHTLWKESKGGSPVSVIDFEVGEDGEWRWSIKQSPAHVDFIREQSLGEEEEREPFGAEEEAIRLLDRVKAPTSGDCTSCNRDEDRLLVDFFRSELTEGTRHGNRTRSDEGYGVDLVRRAECWMRGECHVGSSYEWGLDGKKEAYLKDMEKGESWIKFDEDHEGIVVEIENAVWSRLVDELLGNIFPNRLLNTATGRDNVSLVMNHSTSS